jgi:hypothetical protein
MTVDAVAMVGPAADLVRWGQAASAAHALAQSLCRTRFVPEVFRGEDKVGDATAAILLGAEVGLSPIASMRALYVAKSGEPTMYARTIVALVTSRGHEVWTESEGEGRVTVAGRRAGSEHVERVTWTLDRAKAAGLSGRNNVYRDHPQAMLYARASADVARRIAPDVLLGIPEGLADESGGSAEPVEATVAIQRRGASPIPPAPPLPPASSGSPPGTGPVRPPDVRQPEPEAVLPDLTGAAEVPDDDPQADPPEPLITGPQRAKLHAEFNAAGMGRDAYLAWSADKVGHHLATTNDLTVTEASHLLDIIERAKADRAATEPPEPEPPDRPDYHPRAGG